MWRYFPVCLKRSSSFTLSLRYSYATCSTLIYALGYGYSGMVPSNQRYSQTSATALPTLRGPLHIYHFLEEKIKVCNIASGYGFALFHDNDSNVYGLGINSENQLCMQSSSLEPVATPTTTQLSHLPVSQPQFRVKSLSCGRAHSAVVIHQADATTNTVLTFGLNAQGQCGRTEAKTDTEPKMFLRHHSVTFPRDLTIEQVECGMDHTLLLTNKGEVLACGLGADGQTGLGHYHNTHQPALVQGDLQGQVISSLSSRGDTVLALSVEGRVFAWGNSEYHQLFSVLPPNPPSSLLQMATPRHIDLKAVNPELEGGVVQVAAAGAMCALLDRRGQVYVWGQGYLGLAPSPTTATQPTKLDPVLWNHEKVHHLSAGLHHFALITEETRTLYLWGSPRAGFGWPPSATAHYSWALPTRVALPPSVRVEQVSCGVDHTLIRVSVHGSHQDYEHTGR